MKRTIIGLLLIVIATSIVAGCVTGVQYTAYSAKYNLSLFKMERPEKATQRYGMQKIDSVFGDSKYNYSFEDDLVKILWVAGSRKIAFTLENKTDHSIKIPWDEAAFVDEKGRSHRIMHAGVTYIDREKPQAPSVVVRKGTLEDIVFPTDYIQWREGRGYSAGRWYEEPFFLDFDYHGYRIGTYASFTDFENRVKANVGKTYQVLLPLQIEDVVNDYIFSFRVESVTTKFDSSSSTSY